MTELSQSREEYLKAIDGLARCGGAATVTGLAARMSVTKASASLAVTDLERLGLARRTSSRRIALTEAGASAVALLLGRYEIIQAYFAKVLGVSPHTAARTACILEHLLCEEILQAMDKQLHELPKDSCPLPQQLPDNGPCSPGKEARGMG